MESYGSILFLDLPKDGDLTIGKYPNHLIRRSPGIGAT